MSVKIADKKVVHMHGRRAAKALRALAARADRGDVVGVAVAAWTFGGGPELMIAGVFERSLPTAHYAVTLLRDSLLYQPRDL